MKALSALLVTALLALLPLYASSADSSKTLKNTKGSVTYGPGTTPNNKLAPQSTATLNDNDSAQTGASSQATITLPDSSVITMGSSSNVQMVSFDQSDITHAKFVVIGKMRFDVKHPSGAQADYKFSTSTGEIAVRGTVGDIFAQPGGGLQVNVYALSNPALPVQVTLANGQVFTLAAGQSLVATSAAGAVTASVTSVSQSMFTPFSELGAPANAGELGITAAGAGAAGAGVGAATGAATTTAIVAGAAGAAAAAAVISNSNSSTPVPAPTQTPTPTPQPSTTSLPITVNKAPHAGAHPTPGAR